MLTFSHTIRARHKWDKVYVTKRDCVLWSSLHPLSARRSVHLPYSGFGLPGAIASFGHLCTPSLLVSLGSLLLDCAREPPESKGEKKQKVRAAAVVSTYLCTATIPASRHDVAVLDWLLPDLSWEQRSKRAELGDLLLRSRCPREGMWSEAQPHPQADRPEDMQGPLRRCSPET